VAKPELGTKRLCAGCGAKFYDLNKDPITCPKCGTVYEVVVVAPRGRPDAAAARAAAAQAAEQEPESQEAEFVSLEEADAETEGGAKKAPVEGVEDVEDVEVEGGEEDDATFIEETEEEDADVTEIIGGDIENEEET
jgi:uncharacterized protein (TIGR02300 family)